MRSVYERMTAPTKEDLAVAARLKTMTPPEVAKIVEHMAQVMEHLADQQNALTVERLNEGNVTGFTVRFDGGTVNPLLYTDNPLFKRQ
jgi:hypothetical protein